MCLQSVTPVGVQPMGKMVIEFQTLQASAVSLQRTWYG